MLYYISLLDLKFRFPFYEACFTCESKPSTELKPSLEQSTSGRVLNDTSHHDANVIAATVSITIFPFCKTKQLKRTYNNLRNI